ncbi:MAG: peptidoglycan-binding domain-containing protein [Lachnospiraceae bacterium]
MWQNAMNLDYGSGLSVDGIVGSRTLAAMDGHTVRRGERQYMVTALEILLMLKGYDAGGVESPGIFGGGLEAAVRRYQKVCRPFGGRNRREKYFYQPGLLRKT